MQPWIVECFIHLLFLSSESELEEILTMYTKQNKSASIFLGTGTTGKPPAGNGTDQVPADKNLENSAKSKSFPVWVSLLPVQ